MLADSFLDHDVLADLTALWTERLTDPIAERYVLLAEAEHGPAGFICVQADKHPARGSLIDNLHVTANRQRSGIGRQLMHRGALWLRDVRPNDGVYLGVMEQNERARRFYASLGGQDDGMWDEETHGAATAPSRRIVWANPAVLNIGCGLGGG